MQIKQQFLVDGQYFDSMEEAQDYVDNSADRVLLAAFIAKKKAAGSLRIPVAMLEEFLEFTKTFDPKEEQKQEEPVEEKDNPPFVPDAPKEEEAPEEEEDTSTTVLTGEDQETKVEDSVEQGVSGEVEGTKTTALSGLTNTEKSKSLFARR